MNNKGFTLVELIVTLILISLMTTLVLVNMVGLQSKEDDQSYALFKSKIETAGCAYIDEQNNNLIREVCVYANNGCNVSLQTLINEGLVDGDLKDTNTNLTADEEGNKAHVNIKWIDDNEYKTKTCTLAVSDTDENLGDFQTNVGNATSEQVLHDITFTSKWGVNQTGTMPNYGDFTWNPNGSETKTFAAGYFSKLTLDSSGAYNAGIAAADARVNKSSESYKTGYNDGVSAADSRVNNDSESYKAGYNAGYTAGKAAGTIKITYLGYVGAGGGASFNLPVAGLTADNIWFKNVSASGSGTSRDNRWYGFGGSGGGISISVSGTTCSVYSSKPSVQDNGTAQLSVGVNAQVYAVYTS
jgi:prepilin-type N-terminal cleavage/methylation domain-containing protein